MKSPHVSSSRVFRLGAVLTALLLGEASHAEPAAPTKIVLAVDGLKVVRSLPVLLADHLGYFTDEGLEVTFLETSASAKVDEMLADGRAAGMVAYYPRSPAKARAPT